MFRYIAAKHLPFLHYIFRKIGQIRLWGCISISLISLSIFNWLNNMKPILHSFSDVRLFPCSLEFFLVCRKRLMPDQNIGPFRQYQNWPFFFFPIYLFMSFWTKDKIQMQLLRQLYSMVLQFHYRDSEQLQTLSKWCINKIEGIQF